MVRAANPTDYPTGGGQTGMGLPWTAHLFPFIEQGPLYNAINFTIDWQASGNAGIWGTNLAVMKCPSDGSNTLKYTNSSGDWARGNYGANLGICMSVGGSNGPAVLYKNQNGAHRGPLGFQMSGSLASITDGTSNTVLLWELRSGPVSGDPRGTWGLGRVGTNCVSGCDNWGDCFGINEGNHDNGDDVQNCVNQPSMGLGCWGTGDGQGGPKSVHPGGVHALLGDASTRFVSQTINMGSNGNANRDANGVFAPLRAIGSASGGESVGDF
jgi:hypothetical protein